MRNVLIAYLCSGAFFYVTITVVHCVKKLSFKPMIHNNHGWILGFCEMVISMILCLIIWPILLIVWWYDEKLREKEMKATLKDFRNNSAIPMSRAERRRRR